MIHIGYRENLTRFKSSLGESRGITESIQSQDRRSLPSDEPEGAASDHERESPSLGLCHIHF